MITIEELIDSIYGTTNVVERRFSRDDDTYKFTYVVKEIQAIPITLLTCKYISLTIHNDDGKMSFIIKFRASMANIILDMLRYLVLNDICRPNIDYLCGKIGENVAKIIKKDSQMRAKIDKLISEIATLLKLNIQVVYYIYGILSCH